MSLLQPAYMPMDMQGTHRDKCSQIATPPGFAPALPGSRRVPSHIGDPWDARVPRQATGRIRIPVQASQMPQSLDHITPHPHPSCSQGQRRPLFQGDRRAGSSPEPSGPALKEAPILPPGPAQPLQRAGRGAVGLGCLQPTSSLPTFPVLCFSS